MRFVKLTQALSGDDIWINMDMIESIQANSDGTGLYYQALDGEGDGCYTVKESPLDVYSRCIETDWK